MATLPPLPSLSKYPWMPELLCHPWTSHGWPPCLPFPLCLSIRGCQSYSAIHGWPPLPSLSQSYCAIHGPAMDGHPASPSLSVYPWMAALPPLPSLSKYPWMPELLCHPWSIHGWPPCLPFPLCLSIRGCQSYSAIHGASMDGHPASPSLSV